LHRFGRGDAMRTDGTLTWGMVFGDWPAYLSRGRLQGSSPLGMGLLDKKEKHD